MSALTKKEAEKNSVDETLRLIYNREIHEGSLAHMSKEKLQQFVLELFNKGILNNYLNLK